MGWLEIRDAISRVMWAGAACAVGEGINFAGELGSARRVLLRDGATGWDRQRAKALRGDHALEKIPRFCLRAFSCPV